MKNDADKLIGKRFEIATEWGGWFRIVSVHKVFKNGKVRVRAIADKSSKTQTFHLSPETVDNLLDC